MTVTSEPPPVEALDAGVIEEARARQRRHRGMAATATVVMAAAIATVVLVFDGGGGSSKAGRGSVDPGRPAGTTARASLVACSHAKPFIDGAPSQSLLSILGVLRRPAMAADALPAYMKQDLAMSFRFSGVEAFINYARRARVIAGSPYYVMPVLDSGCGFLRGGEPQRMLLSYPGGGGGAGDAEAIKQGADPAGTGYFAHSNVVMLVPDGVATVTLRYPAGKIGGFDRHHAPAFTVTTQVVGNLLVVTVPRSGNRLKSPTTMTWRAADGAIVKRFSRL